MASGFNMRMRSPATSGNAEGVREVTSKTPGRIKASSPLPSPFAAFFFVFSAT
jgi:hypothetical protein